MRAGKSRKHGLETTSTVHVINGILLTAPRVKGSESHDLCGSHLGGEPTTGLTTFHWPSQITRRLYACILLTLRSAMRSGASLWSALSPTPAPHTGSETCQGSELRGARAICHLVWGSGGTPSGGWEGGGVWWRRRRQSRVSADRGPVKYCRVYYEYITLSGLLLWYWVWTIVNLSNKRIPL